MIEHCSETSVGRRALAPVSNERGAVLAVVALSLVAVLASAGLAIDAGRGYIERVRISRAVDGGALAAARVLRSGQAAAREEAESVARANGVVHGVDGTVLEIEFGTNDRGENTVLVSASRPLPTTFMRVLDFQELTVAAEAEAAVPPLDILLVLDTSGSLAAAGAWDELQDAAIAFVEYFSDEIDQMGVVSFQVSAHDVFELRHTFRLDVSNAIESMVSDGDTNIQQGLGHARAQMQLPAARPSAAKAVVFFTDGRPTAVRGAFGGQDRIMAVYTTVNNRVRAYFDDPDDIPPGFALYPGDNWPGGCVVVTSCFGLGEQDVRQLAADEGLVEADLLRQDGILVYSIGLGNLSYGPGDLRTPDLDYLLRIANEGGIESNSQPQGRMFFAPSSSELRSVFEEVAQDLVVRLAR